MRHTTAALALSAALAAALASTPAAAQGRKGKPEDAARLDLNVKQIASGGVTVDGFITDWEGIPGISTQALVRGEHEYDWTGPKDLSLTVQAQYDDKNLYLAVTVKDNVVTSPKSGKPGDFVEFWIDGGPIAARSKHGRLRMLKLAPGDLAKGGKPSITWAWPAGLRGAPAGLTSDGAIRVDGYFFEFAVPLTELGDPPPGIEPIGAAFLACDYDYDDPAESQAAVATAPFDSLRGRSPDTLGSLILSNTRNLKEGIYRLVPQSRDAPVVAQVYADVGGDNRREYVQLLGRWLSISGYGLGDGQYYYLGLPATNTTQFKKLELRDVTGDGKDDMLVTYTITYDTSAGPVEQELFGIYHFYYDRIKLVYLAETANRGRGWAITNTVQFKENKRGKAPDITLAAGTSSGSPTAQTYPDPDGDLIVDWERIILPWDEVKSRRYTWENSQFIKN